MKKKLILVAACLVAVAASAGVLINANGQSDASLLMQNVEALTNDEGSTGGGGGRGRSVCYSAYAHADNASLLRCSTCDWVDGIHSGASGYCKQ